MPRMIIAGGRDFSDYNTLVKEVVGYCMSKGYKPEDIEVISGMASGADRLGETFALTAGCKLTKFKPEWEVHGKSAGFIRNSDMANYASEDKGVCFCFWDGRSKGTRHMINIAKKKKLETIVIKYGGDN